MYIYIYLCARLVLYIYVHVYIICTSIVSSLCSLWVHPPTNRYRCTHPNLKSFWFALDRNHASASCFQPCKGRKIDDKHLWLSSEGEDLGGMKMNIKVCNLVVACFTSRFGYQPWMIEYIYILYLDYTQMRFIQSIIMSFISMIDPWSHFCRNPQLPRLNGSPRTHPKIAVRLSSLLQLRICSTRAGDSSWSVKAWWWGVERTFWIIIVFFAGFFLIFINHSCCWKTSIDPMPSSMIYHAVT